MENRRQLLQGDRATVFLLDKSVNELWSAMADGMKEIRIPANAGLTGSVVSSRRSLVLRDAYEDPRFNRSVDAATGYRTKSMICCPILSSNESPDEQEILGVVQIINRCGERDVFLSED